MLPLDRQHVAVDRVTAAAVGRPPAAMIDDAARERQRQADSRSARAAAAGRPARTGCPTKIGVLLPSVTDGGAGLHDAGVPERDVEREKDAAANAVQQARREPRPPRSSLTGTRNNPAIRTR